MAVTMVIRLGDEFRLHPEYQGPRFSWDSFPDMMRRMAQAQGPISYSPRQWTKARHRELTKIIGDAAYEAACGYVTCHHLWSKKEI